MPPSAYCNPLSVDPKCGVMQCGANADTGQLLYQCTTVGDQSACEGCDPTLSSNCELGLSCVLGVCVRLCCLAGDCPGGTCDKEILPGGGGGLGICVSAI